MVAILAITGRCNLRTIGRAVMLLTVREAGGMKNTGSWFDSAHFSPRRAKVNSL